MVKSCCAPGCQNRFKKDSNISFYRFPKDKDRRQAWVNSLKRKLMPSLDNAYVCSEHFITKTKSSDKNHPDFFVPSIFKHTSSPVKRRKVENVKKAQRKASRSISQATSSVLSLKNIVNENALKRILNCLKKNVKISLDFASKSS